MKIRLIITAAIIGLGISAALTPAQATPVNSDQWYTFGFGGTGSSLLSGPGFITGIRSIVAPDTPWEFNCNADHCKFIITDGFNAGDKFTILDFGVSIGATSPAANIPGYRCGNDEVACLLTTDFSIAPIFWRTAPTLSRESSVILPMVAGQASSSSACPGPHASR